MSCARGAGLGEGSVTEDASVMRLYARMDGRGQAVCGDVRVVGARAVGACVDANVACGGAGVDGGVYLRVCL